MPKAVITGLLYKQGHKTSQFLRPVKMTATGLYDNTNQICGIFFPDGLSQKGIKWLAGAVKKSDRCRAAGRCA